MRSGRDGGDMTVVDRRTFLRLAGIGGVGVLSGGLGARRAFAETLDPAAVSRMEFDVTYRTTVHELPRDAEALSVWIPVPPSNAAQDIEGLAIDSPLPHAVQVEGMYGNRLVHVRSGRLVQGVTVEVRYHVVRRRAEALRGPLPATAAEKYLRLTNRVRVTPEVEAFAKRATGASSTPRDVARGVYDAIIEMLTYDKTIPGCGTGDTAWIMKHRRGRCDDYHALFMAVLISRGIPVRWEQGFPLPYPSERQLGQGQLRGDCSGAHCWVSFRDPELGWVPVDVSEADKNANLREFFFGRLTPNRFKISEGRAISLEPRQRGEPLSAFAYAYAEADGIPLIYPENYENTVRYEITHVEVDRA